MNLGNLEWFDDATSATIRLTNGRGERLADVVEGRITSTMTGPVVYADVDGDGDEDAAAGLHSVGEQLVADSWSVWLWQDGRPLQVRRPIAVTSRCDKPIESVAAEPTGFRVRAFVAIRGDDCATGGSLPVTYVAAVRDGWPVRIEPTYGPIETCDPRYLIHPVRPQGATVLRTSQDDRSPAVTATTRFSRLLVNWVDASPYLEPGESTRWVLLLAEKKSGKTTRQWCGWVRLSYPLS
ncbi:hypothetical protein [Frankia sp. AgB32]|uniref:hypothetical protein n=1 Tax=Frankia sp. AgB32 TaxID=631119 RepID=UPI00200C838F|nr:hypothetical protein [Frankia sp. AgB32]MCK9896840.1 hypothetical protein [Frankia sp. AgB32]